MKKIFMCLIALITILNSTIFVFGNEKEYEAIVTDYVFYYNDVQITFDGDDDVQYAKKLYTIAEKSTKHTNELYINNSISDLFNAMNLFFIKASDVDLKIMDKSYLRRNSQDWIPYADFIKDYGFYEDSITNGLHEEILGYYLFSPDSKRHISITAPEKGGYLGIMEFFQGPGGNLWQGVDEYFDGVGFGDNYFIRVSDIEKMYKRIDGKRDAEIERLDLYIGDLSLKKYAPIIFPNKLPNNSDSYSFEVINSFLNKCKLTYNDEKKDDIPSKGKYLLLKPLMENLNIAYIQNDSKKYVLLYSYDYIMDNNWVDIQKLNEDIEKKNATLKRSKIKPFVFDYEKKQFRLTGTGKKSVFLESVLFDEGAFINKNIVNDFMKKYYNVTLY